MNTSIRFKSILAYACHFLGVDTRVQRMAGNSNITILMYHRVIPGDEAIKTVQAGMYVTPETFNIHVGFLKDSYKIVPITALPEYFQLNDPGEKPFCILTFDDGWHDFYKYAFPILKQYRVPATVFLPTEFVGTSRWFWTDRLAHLFMQRTRARGPAESYGPPCTIADQLEKLRGSLGSRIEAAISLLKDCGSEQIEKVLLELSTRWAVETVPRGRAFLSWEEVREMQRSGLVFFGSHTAGHRILTSLTDEEIRSELIRSKDKLIAEHAVDPSFIPFCYPNGNYNDAIVRCVQETGYDLAVTTEKGWNHPGSDRFTLKRIAVHQDMTSNEAMLGCRIAGIL